jgi:ATP-dependent exoDNAse (exonuclease V) beta subunit
MMIDPTSNSRHEFNSESEPILVDRQARLDALNIHQSCIVQAPAGSGKTELLTLRFLKLLSICEKPEEVLAITFTKKAASEMQQRIINALQWGALRLKENYQPELLIEEQRLAICKSVLIQNEKKQWNLLANPGRLRVQTIDGFCLFLASQLPILSQLGGNPSIDENVDNCFREAIYQTLDKLESNTEISADIECLLHHLDNDIAKVERLFTDLLKNRDQWLSHVVAISDSSEQAKNYLQGSLKELIEESLTALYTSLLDQQELIIELVNHAASNLTDSDKNNFTDFVELTKLPAGNFTGLRYWLFFANLFLTGDNNWRKTINKTLGFPTGNPKNKEYQELAKSRKNKWGDLRDTLMMTDGMQEALSYLKLLPDPSIDSKQWQFVASLTKVLNLLSGELLLAFKNHGIIDYVQIQAAARLALGTAEYPTDLTLSLDHKIQHILVDEFQDTSQLQLEILEQLTQGWQSHDGRTLFLVGDAMQSCYGFRNANVGIYLNVRAQGLGDIKLTPLLLQTNFRSQAALVNWVNRIFTASFPKVADSSRGAVPYSPSAAFHNSSVDSGVKTTIISYDIEERQRAKELEAQQITDTIIGLRQDDPNSSVAILVRSRSHLNTLIPHLREAGLQWQSTDIDRMESQIVIDDLLSLSRAISNLSDSLAWLSILRAPWCGLTSKDLLAISQHETDKSIWHSLQQASSIKKLSTDGLNRVIPLIKALKLVIEFKSRTSLRQLVESAWLLLQGRHVLSNATQQDCVDRYLELLGQQETSGNIPNWEKFQQLVSKSYLPSSLTGSNTRAIHILTMHKSKGLEFDHVILPALASKTGGDSKNLLQWHRRLNANGQSRLFVAALPQTGSDDSQLYQLLRHEEKQKSLFESTRLLYIAITRARCSTHLFAIAPRNNKGEINPEKNSLLARIWNSLQCEVNNVKQIRMGFDRPVLDPHTDDKIDFPNPTTIRRFESPPVLHDDLIQLINSQLEFKKSPASSLEVDLKQPTNAPDRLRSILGTLIHEAFETIVTEGIGIELDSFFHSSRKYWQLKIRHFCENSSAIDDHINFIEKSIRDSVLDSNYGWIFDPNLEGSQCELQLTKKYRQASFSYVVDRTFIDNKGVRWIIDYKSSVLPRKLSVNAFIEQQSNLYRSQLEQYLDLFNQLEQRPIKLALFFTNIPILVELN